VLRRGFLKLLGAAPFAAVVPLPKVAAPVAVIPPVNWIPHARVVSAAEYGYAMVYNTTAVEAFLSKNPGDTERIVSSGCCGLYDSSFECDDCGYEYCECDEAEE